MATHLEKLEHLAAVKGLIRSRDLEDSHIPRAYLKMACDRGILQRIARGLYSRPNGLHTEHHSLIEVCKIVPDGVICLASALRFHKMTTQAPYEVWLAIGESRKAPKNPPTMIRAFRFSLESLNAGVETHMVNGVELRVFNAAKTVADCFKFRNKIGVDIASEALRDYLRQRKGKIEDLLRYSRICRVEQVIQPYLEALL